LIDGIPWSTIVENWCHQLGNKPFDEVSDYAKDFVKYFVGNLSSHITPLDASRSFLNHWRRRLKLELSQIPEAEKNPEGIRQVFAELTAALGGRQSLTNREESYLDDLLEHYGSNGRKNESEAECRHANCPFLDHSSIEGQVREVFEGMLDEEAFETIREWSHVWLASFHPGTGSAQLTFTGYGEKEFLPSWITVSIEGQILSRSFHEFTKQGRAKITQNGGYCFLETFALDGDIKRFLTAARKPEDFYNSLVAAALDNVRDGKTIASWVSEISGPPSTEDEVGESEESLNREEFMNKHLESFGHEFQSSFELATSSTMAKVYSHLAGMNLKNMASVAARLLDLQNLAFDLVGEVPWVGGGASIGVITKAHGFVPLKRIQESEFAEH
jgi:hypothetical protein